MKHSALWLSWITCFPPDYNAFHPSQSFFPMSQSPSPTARKRFLHFQLSLLASALSSINHSMSSPRVASTSSSKCCAKLLTSIFDNSPVIVEINLHTQRRHFRIGTLRCVSGVSLMALVELVTLLATMKTLICRHQLATSRGLEPSHQ